MPLLLVLICISITDEDDLTLLDAMAETLDLSDLDELDLPLVIFFDEEWTDQASWGPRPTAAEALLEAWLEEHPDYETLAADESDDAQDAFAALQDELIHTMRLWYNTSLNRVCVDEIIDVLDSLASADDATSDDDEGMNLKRVEFPHHESLVCSFRHCLGIWRRLGLVESIAG